MARVLILLSVILFSVYVTEQAYFLEKSYIDSINAQATTWKAGVNFHPSTSKEDMVKLLGFRGVQSSNKTDYKMYKSEDPNYAKINNRVPRAFDARKKWSKCKTIGAVRDQGNCGSGWTFAPTTAFADRLCIATDGDFNQYLSPEEITFCCQECGDGCNGGYSLLAWEHFQSHGLVTGGEYQSGEGCAPYKVPPCTYDSQGHNSCSGKPFEKNHKCPTTCYGNKHINFDDDHRFAKDAYQLSYENIEKDVMTYGPVSATFDVYDDFYSYKSGVYKHTQSASYLGEHSAKLIGWGVERGVQYWLMVNSWNEHFGDRGFFKIQRGTNECNIENLVTAGLAESS